MEQFHERVAVVTGGASGIGLGIARTLLAAGAQVAILDLRPDHLANANTDLEAAGYKGRFAGFETDVSDREAMAETAQQVLERFGHVHVLVNNAGIGIQRAWDRVTYEDWDFGLQVNLGGVINGLMTYLPLIKAGGGGGHVVNTASLAGLSPVPSDLAIYGTTKSAIVALSESLAPDLAASGIGLSIVCPGLVRSNIHEIDLNRPVRFGNVVDDRETVAEDAEREASTSWMDPDEVGHRVIEGIRSNRLYVITHADHRAAFEQRCAAILEAYPTR